MRAVGAEAIDRRASMRAAASALDTSRLRKGPDKFARAGRSCSQLPHWQASCGAPREVLEAEGVHERLPVRLLRAPQLLSGGGLRHSRDGFQSGWASMFWSWLAFFSTQGKMTLLQERRSARNGPVALL